MPRRFSIPRRRSSHQNTAIHRWQPLRIVLALAALAGLVALAGTAPVAAQAPITVYTDAGSFAAAAGPLTTIDFETLPRDASSCPNPFPPPNRLLQTPSRSMG